MSDVSVQRILQVVRDFHNLGGASVELTAWELCTDPRAIQDSWEEAVARGLLHPSPETSPAPTESQRDEEMFTLSATAWQLLGIDPHTDLRRAEAIDRLGVLQRISDPTLTALTRITAHIMGSTSAAVHVFDERYQHRVAATNAPLGTHPAHDAMCRLVLDRGEAIIVSDASLDPRFGFSTFTTGHQPIVRFYASTPLQASDGTVVGTLCAFDDEVIELTDAQRALLIDLGQQAIAQIEFTRVAVDLDELVPRAG